MNTPHRLWSLWDMLRFYAHQFVRLSSILASMSGLFSSVGKDFNDGDRRIMEKEIGEANFLLSEVGLNFSAKMAQRILEKAKSKHYDAAYFVNQIQVLHERIKDELQERYCLCLEPHEAALYAPIQSLVGQEIEAKFPSILYEIDESAKCAALGRDTASAFHAIRCLEAGLRAISACLGVPDPTKGAERNWNQILGNIKKASDVKWPTSKDRFSGDGKLFEELHATLHAMQNPYRNATMHLDARYSKDEAEVIRIVVKAFLIKVSLRMDENGEPKV